ncbi:hypothetical protein ACWEGQ_00210 [Streptomyces seoulensis]
MIDNLGFHTHPDYTTELTTIQTEIRSLTSRINIGNFHNWEAHHNTWSHLHDLHAQEKNLLREIAMENQRLNRLETALRAVGDIHLGFIAYIVFGPAALPVEAMYEVRLLDDNGYTVPDTVRTNLPASRIESAKRHLLTVDAPKHARLWGAHVSDYRVQVTPF